MKATHEELLTLLKLVDITEPQEIDCEEFLHRVAGYLEQLSQKPDVPTEDEAFLHHLRVCPECLEEFQALYRVFCSDESGGSENQPE